MGKEEFSKAQRQWAIAYAKCGDAIKAATYAGYGNAHQGAEDNLSNAPLVRYSDKQREKLIDSYAREAVEFIRSLIVDGDASRSIRLDAAKYLVRLSGAEARGDTMGKALATASDKPLYELSIEELAQKVLDSVKTIEVIPDTPSPDAPPTPPLPSPIALLSLD